jgi:hypothetical protein
MVCRVWRGWTTVAQAQSYDDYLQNMLSFAGENYETPVISEKARSLLTRFADRADHYQLSGSSRFEFSDPG